jgi:hypothetical protein
LTRIALSWLVWARESSSVSAVAACQPPVGLVITATQYPLDEVLFAGDRIDGFPM